MCGPRTGILKMSLRSSFPQPQLLWQVFRQRNKTTASPAVRVMSTLAFREQGWQVTLQKLTGLMKGQMFSQGDWDHGGSGPGVLLRQWGGTGFSAARSHQKGAQHEEADEIDDGKVAPTGELFPRLIIRLRVTAFAGQAGQHDFLPGLPRCTPGEMA